MAPLKLNMSGRCLSPCALNRLFDVSLQNKKCIITIVAKKKEKRLRGFADIPQANEDLRMEAVKMNCSNCHSHKWDGAQYDHLEQKIIQCSDCHEWDEKNRCLKPKVQA